MNGEKYRLQFRIAYEAVEGWKPPPRKYWENVGLFCLCGIVTGFWTHGVVFILFLQAVPSSIILSLPLILFTIIFSGALFLLMGFLDTKESMENYVKRNNSLRRTLYVFFPPLVFFWHIPRGLYWTVRMIPVAIGDLVEVICDFGRFLKRFGWEFFLRIHSEMRLLCGVDAMLGTAAGYFAGSAVIGTLVGGIFGVINYVLVTERFLKRRGYISVPS